MGHKKICLDCRLTLNREFDDGSKRLTYPCPNCQKEMILLPHRFRPPKKSDEQKWKVVEYLIGQGFRYEHTFREVPENIRDAKEFWAELQRRKENLNNQI